MSTSLYTTMAQCTGANQIGETGREARQGNATGRGNQPIAGKFVSSLCLRQMA